MTPLVIIGKIKELKASGLNQVQIAKQLGYSQTGISKICKRHDISWPIGAAARDQYGENNPTYKNGLGRSTIERTTRYVVKESGRNLFMCERCGFESHDVELPRHHIDEDRSNNKTDNIEVLCIPCHNKVHNKNKSRDVNGRFMP